MSCYKYANPEVAAFVPKERQSYYTLSDGSIVVTCDGPSTSDALIAFQHASHEQLYSALCQLMGFAEHHCQNVGNPNGPANFLAELRERQLAEERREAAQREANTLRESAEDAR